MLVLAEVLVEVKAKQIEETFTYHIPDSLLDEVVVGKRVLVPFGPRKVEGFVLSIVQKEVDFPLKDVEEVIDEEAILNKELLDLGKYISQITFSSLISSYQVMLPKALKARHGKKVAIKEVSYISLIDATYHPRTPKQKELLDLLQGGPVLKKELENYSSSLKTLLEKGILEETKKEVYRRTAICEVEKERPTLTSEQEEVIERVEKKKSTFSPFLLHGVT